MCWNQDLKNYKIINKTYSKYANCNQTGHLINSIYTQLYKIINYNKHH